MRCVPSTNRDVRQFSEISINRLWIVSRVLPAQPSCFVNLKPDITGLVHLTPLPPACTLRSLTALQPWCGYTRHKGKERPILRVQRKSETEVSLQTYVPRVIDIILPWESHRLHCINTGDHPLHISAQFSLPVMSQALNVLSIGGSRNIGYFSSIRLLGMFCADLS